MMLSVAACGKKDVLLLEQLPATPVVNPATKLLIRDHNLLNVQIHGNGIRGFTKAHVFHTEDGFRSFSHSPISIPDLPLFMVVDGDGIAISNAAVSTSPILISTNYGDSWTNITPQITGTPGGGLPDIVYSYQFPNSSTLLALTGNTETLFPSGQQTNNAFLYAMNPATGQGSLRSTIPGYQPWQMDFYSSSSGYVLLSRIMPAPGGGTTSTNTYIARTTDGGHTWNIPVLVSATDRLRLSVGPDGYVFLHSGNGGGYFSSDGITWTKSNNNLRFYDVAVVNSSVMYASVETGLQKSTDGGVTWADVQTYRFIYHKLAFENELHGIAWIDKIVYETKDGGNTWQILLYPYPYILE